MRFSLGCTYHGEEQGTVPECLMLWTVLSQAEGVGGGVFDEDVDGFEG